MERRMGLGLSGLMLVIATILLGACATITSAGTLKTDAPLPQPPIAVIQPGPGIAPELAAFSGAWFGRWDGQMDHILVIEQIESPEKIIAIYSWGKGFGSSPGWVRVVGVFAENELRLQLRPETIATYRMRGDTLKAVYQFKRICSEANMKRINLDLISR